jgi:hypothetical protein
MEQLIAPILFIGVVLYVAYPLFSEPEEDVREDPRNLDREQALEEKENLVANLKDIEMDYQMGKLSEKDYELLKSDFEGQAVGVFDRLEQLGPKKRSKMKKK